MASLAGLHAAGVCVDVETLASTRFSRRFDWLRDPTFLSNPCCRSTSPDSGQDEVEDSAESSVDRVDAEGLTEASVGDLVRALVARSADMPESMIGDEQRLLADLHLTSISVGEIVTRVALKFGMSELIAPTEFAEATVGELTVAIEDRLQSGGADGAERRRADGLAAWTRAYRVKWVEARDDESLVLIARCGGSAPRRRSTRGRTASSPRCSILCSPFGSKSTRLSGVSKRFGA